MRLFRWTHDLNQKCTYWANQPLAEELSSFITTKFYTTQQAIHVALYILFYIGQTSASGAATGWIAVHAQDGDGLRSDARQGPHRASEWEAPNTPVGRECGAWAL